MLLDGKNIMLSHIIRGLSGWSFTWMDFNYVTLCDIIASYVICGVDGPPLYANFQVYKAVWLVACCFSEPLDYSIPQTLYS